MHTTEVIYYVTVSLADFASKRNPTWRLGNGGCIFLKNQMVLRTFLT